MVKNEHQALINGHHLHLKLLDRLVDLVFKKICNYFKRHIKSISLSCAKKMKSSKMNMSYCSDLILTHQIEEIQAADLQPDEEDILNEEKNQLVNFQKLVKLLMNNYHLAR